MKEVTTVITAQITAINYAPDDFDGQLLPQKFIEDQIKYNLMVDDVKVSKIQTFVLEVEDDD